MSDPLPLLVIVSPPDPDPMVTVLFVPDVVMVSLLPLTVQLTPPPPFASPLKATESLLPLTVRPPTPVPVWDYLGAGKALGLPLSFIAAIVAGAEGSSAVIEIKVGMRDGCMNRPA